MRHFACKDLCHATYFFGCLHGATLHSKRVLQHASPGKSTHVSLGEPPLYRVSQKRVPFLENAVTPSLMEEIFQIVCGSSQMVLFCTNDVLSSGGAANRKCRHNIAILYFTTFSVFCTLF